VKAEGIGGEREGDFKDNLIRSKENRKALDVGGGVKLVKLVSHPVIAHL
jgi:hypothetical protein